MDVKVYELLVCVKLKKDIYLKNMAEELSIAINHLLKNDENLAISHKNNKINNYCYSLFNPTELGNPHYKKNEEYFFTIRTIDRNFALIMEDLLYDIENNLFETIRVTTQRILNNENLGYLWSITPTLLTITEDNVKRYWLANNDELDFVKERILNNTYKKYKEFISEDIKEIDFIEKVELLNTNNYVANYKNGCLLGSKMRIFIKQDKQSQDLAKVILGCGLLEKNSLSFGFCGGKLKI